MRRPTPSSLWARRPWMCTQCRSRYSSSYSTSAAAAPNLRAGHNKKTNLPDAPARTRFAPSPTGYLHLGSLRTALFNYLLAKRTGGQFLLRIEDTDQKRTIPDAEQRLYDDLHWAGLHWDEGPIVGGPYGPYRQSERTAIYRSHAQELINNGHAYRCFCSAERLDTFARHRSEAGLPPGYDRKCGEVSAAESEERAARGDAHVVRLKVEGYPMFHDLVYGKTGQNRSPNKLDLIERVYDDPILIKSDGHPTYHLANVVDDHCMKITHVIRGTEWMPSTPLHVALYNAFKWTPPQFGHVPLLVDKSGQKLSKRNADIDLSSFKDTQGIFAATLVNFAALLGWSHTQKSDVFSLDELEQIFNLKITRGNTVVAFEKLWFLQKAHAQRFAATSGPEFDEMVTKVSEVVEATYPAEQLYAPYNPHPPPPITPSNRIHRAAPPRGLQILHQRDRLHHPKLHLLQHLPPPPRLHPNPLPLPLRPLNPSPSPPHRRRSPNLGPPTHWTLETHRANITAYDGSSSSSSTTTAPSETTNLSADEALQAKKTADKAFKKELYHYLRWALSAGAPGPGIPETMQILGREETIRRVREAKRQTMDLVPLPTRRAKGDTTPSESGDVSWMGSLAPGQ
ncbi:glutamyl-tRNA synthetase [Aspergillus heteromorphus CBS 117.55]|uniref:Glutamate--tRNA ligase, mitochondrial n=1 Tax=Aspergillus heteromorphus CBS 117.55 TaxID=1448321 RepID=A0A317WUJ6_9EURO|nr:glutamyl-tRNA synthetase [Aspergillus heteromorphus CBS 117.55]PWY88972.1 glutamyl-tRNA synthetase [Aspergillus heteromorphus CBS 117.55]